MTDDERLALLIDGKSREAFQPIFVLGVTLGGHLRALRLTQEVAKFARDIGIEGLEGTAAFALEREGLCRLVVP